MSHGPFSLLSSRMLDFPPHEPVSSYAFSNSALCVAPQDIFSDYDAVIARLKNQSTCDTDDEDGLPFVEIEGMANSHCESQGESPFDVPSSPETISTPSTIDGDDEYIDPPPVRRPTLPKISLSRYSQETRKNRKHRKHTPKKAEVGSTRCRYINPKNGRRCPKLNTSPTEETRHYDSCHIKKEAKAILTGLIPMGSGIMITSHAVLEKIRADIECFGCGAFITRKDAMKRHHATCKPIRG